MTEFWAIVGKVQTMADGGIRVYLDLPETAIVEMVELAAYQINAVVVDVVVTPRPDKEVTTGEQTGGVEKGPKRESKWATEKGPSTN